jgi:hypothetical protein
MLASYSGLELSFDPKVAAYKSSLVRPASMIGCLIV